ncbi:MAG: L-histidine N(alpha)-methyltransferase [Bdellovibrionales bacterium]|nr:L-histidine N(alpha)-methyltransferase [Bdellovibrionales bacterium]
MFFPANLRFVDFHPKEENIRDMVVAGLQKTPKEIPAKLLYDKRGSELFDAITRQPEYYQTRTELFLLERYGEEIGRLLGPRAMIIEFGSGHTRKIRRLFECLEAQRCYMAVEISKEYLLQSCSELAADFPSVDVIAVCADFLRPFEPPPPKVSVRKRTVFFPGSTIGNFEPPTARRLLERAAAHVGKKGGLLIGVDLKKDKGVLEAAYNDAARVTAEFEMNLLHRLNRDIECDFALDGFEYLGFYAAERSRVEMYLVSKREQRVQVGATQFVFAPGERLHTENSYKFTVEEFQKFARGAGFCPREAWVDPDGLFSLHYLEVL